jgi:hypothetical protein
VDGRTCFNIQAGRKREEDRKMSKTAPAKDPQSRAFESRILGEREKLKL